MIDFSNVNANLVAMKKYGVKDPKFFPGPSINNLHNFSDTCYAIVNEFAENPVSVDDVRYSPAGLKCQQAVLNQIYLSGKDPRQAYNAYSPPIVKYTPQCFKKAYIMTQDANKAYELCINMAKTCEDKEMCGLCRDTVLATTNEKLPKNLGHNCPVGVRTPPDGYNAYPPDNVVENFKNEKYTEVSGTNSGGCGCNGVAIAFWVVLGVIALMLIIWSIFIIWKRRKKN